MFDTFWSFIQSKPKKVFFLGAVLCNHWSFPSKKSLGEETNNERKVWKASRDTKEVLKTLIFGLYFARLFQCILRNAFLKSQIQLIFG